MTHLPRLVQMPQAFTDRGYSVNVQWDDIFGCWVAQVFYRREPLSMGAFFSDKMETAEFLALEWLEKTVSHVETPSLDDLIQQVIES